MYNYNDNLWNKGVFEGKIFNLENISNEANIFNQGERDEKFHEFRNELVKLIREIIEIKLKDKQRFIINYFLKVEKPNNFRMALQDLAKVLNVSERNIYQRYQKIVHSLRRNLYSNPRLFKLCEGNTFLENNFKKWAEGQKKYFETTCPICGKTFINHRFKRHLIVSYYPKFKKKLNSVDKKHNVFVKKQEKMIVKCLKKHKHFRNFWVKELLGRPEFFLGFTWVYKFCHKTKHRKKNG